MSSSTDTRTDSQMGIPAGAGTGTPADTGSDQIAERLAGAGLRLTESRRAVLDAVRRASSPMSVPELTAEVGARVPQSSLYRCLADLVEARVLSKVEFAEGFARFELDEDLLAHHHHLVCTGCAAVLDLELGELEAALAALSPTIHTASGFTVTSHRLDFFGRCASCGPA